jgi:hypothetical protein
LLFLVLDVKLEIKVERIEQTIPHVVLRLDERNLNDEINTALSPMLLASSSNINRQNSMMNFDMNRPQMNRDVLHYVQLMDVDSQSQCFHALLWRNCFVTIFNVLKNWNVNQQPMSYNPKPGMLVCAQCNKDDLWYRAWIENVTGRYQCET